MLLRGTEGADVLTGAGEDDTIYGFGGADTLRGGAGDDVLAGNDGNDKLYGGDGDDYILGGPGDDLIDGGAGNDWAAYEDATAGVTVDLTKTGQQNTGGGGRDTLVGIENLYGSDFNDTLIGDAGDNMLVGGKGNDTLSGGKGDDTLWGSEGNDTLDGGDGDDYLVGGAGDDIIKGGAGWDWSSYEDAGAGVTVDLTKTGQQDTIGAGKDTLSGIEHLYGSKFNDVLTGDANNNYLWGDAGDDKLYGGKGDDHLSGGVGVNILDGGEGWDTIDYAFAQTGVEIDLTQNFAKSRGDTSIRDTLVSIEAVMGSAFDDIITGNAAENYLFGDAGDDVIIGVGGNDTLDGGDGNDILRGSFRKPGDILVGGAGDDTAIVFVGPGSEGATVVDGGTGVDSLHFASVYDITFDLANTGDQVVAPGVHFTVSGIENVTGGSGNDRITGDAGNNVISGGAGDDILDGAAGFDIASYEGGPAVRVDLSKTGPQDTRGAGIDTLINFEGLKGSSLGDILIGDAKDNTLEGGMGDDILDGGAGNDTAIYVGASTDYTWTRNANGTWTVRGLEGVDTLLNIETLKFNDKSVTLSPSTTTVTVDDLLEKAKVLATSSDQAFRDVVISADGRTVYVSDSGGYITAINAVTGETTGRVKVGTDLGGIDVSQDGRFLVAAERQVENAKGEQWDYTATAKAHILDLTTWTVTDYATTATGYDRGFADAAFMAGNTVLLTQDFGGSGFTSVTSFNPSVGTFTQTRQEYYQSGTLVTSHDGLFAIVAPAGLSDAPMALLNAQPEQVAERQVYAGGLGGNTGIVAVSNNGLVTAQLMGAGLQIFDRDLKYQFMLSAAHTDLAYAYGLDFSADGEHLFVVDAAKDQILEFSTKTWTLENTFNIGVDIDPFVAGYGGLFGNRVTISDDGGRMVIFGASNVVTVNMLGLKPVTEFVGGEGVDTLVGSVGDDSIRGLGGDDIITGGKGADTLSGGAGADTFVFAPGDTSWSSASDAGVDVVTDWEVVDKLSFSPLDQTIRYGEYTTSSWLGAVTTAPQILAQRNLTHLATQVGPDVYVFHAKPGLNNGTVDNVVKLVNTTLDKIEAANFVSHGGGIHGDDGANVLSGTAFNDVIYGHGGDDVIDGGAGKDILYGGAGADTFKFTKAGSAFDNHDFQLTGVDVIMDFEVGDKLAFEGGTASPGFVHAAHLGSAAAAAVLLEAYWAAATRGVPAPEYIVMGVGDDTWVVHGMNQAVQLKNFSSSLVTADMFITA